MIQAQAGIYRAQLSFEQGFTRIPNRWLRDPRIGFRAKGLLTYLLSHDVGYTITLGQIERETNDGRHAIRSAIDELVSAGYLETQRTHDARGWNAGLAWFLRDPNPESENPTLENPTLENRPAIEENLIEKKTNKEQTLAQDKLERESDLAYVKSSTSEQLLADGFASFWALYPRKTGKGSARKAYDKAVSRSSAITLIEGARRLANDPNLPPMQFIPHPATWLNDDRWEDEPYPPRELTPDEKRARDLAEIAKRKDVDREATRRLLAESDEAKRRAVAPPKCEHGNSIVSCKACLRK